jgi:methylmalonyl-CoA/ethylmalonyl-CoA epimerase
MIRVLVANSGELTGDAAARKIGQVLRDAGLEVVSVDELDAHPAPSRRPDGIPATRLDHSAVCVKDMQASIRLIEELLGQKVAHQEFVEAQKVDAAFFDFPNGASLELVSPRGNAGLEKFLEKRGDALHHLALRVKDIDGVLKRLEARGVPLVDKVSRLGARGHKVAFLHPKAFGGTLLELVEAHEHG